MKKNPRSRLDELLVKNNLAADLKEAQALIMAGLVSVDAIPSLKPGTSCDESALVTLKESNPYVSRGGLKLQPVLKELKVSVEQKICMDIGASTGGFTDCLLQHGAQKVFAVDVGKNLLHYRLRNDPRVINMENVNFRYFSQQNLKEKIEFVTIDVSFISLEKILPPAVDCLRGNGEILALVKPQFEAMPDETVKGVVKDNSVRLKAINKIIDLAKKLGLELLGEMDSPVKGPSGNIEHFIWLRAGHL